MRRPLLRSPGSDISHEINQELNSEIEKVQISLDGKIIETLPQQLYNLTARNGNSKLGNSSGLVSPMNSNAASIWQNNKKLTAPKNTNHRILQLAKKREDLQKMLKRQ